MKLTLLSVVCAAAILFGCSNENAADQHKDTANMLPDTLPAHNLKDSISIDSNPADNTYVDSLNR